MLIFFETDPADAPIRTQLPTLGLLKYLHVGRLLNFLCSCCVLLFFDALLKSSTNETIKKR